MWLKRPNLMQCVQREIEESTQALLSHASAREYHTAMELMLMGRIARLASIRDRAVIDLQTGPAPSAESAPQTAH